MRNHIDHLDGMTTPRQRRADSPRPRVADASIVVVPRIVVTLVVQTREAAP